MIINFGVALCISVTAQASAKKAPAKLESWTSLARKVGQSESDTERENAITALKKIQDLSQRLRVGLTTDDRPLALETISALNLRGLIPELLLKVPTDHDGFLTLAVNSMMDASNQDRILKFYANQLKPEKLSDVSTPTIVAILEPLGRLGTPLPRKALTALASHRSPDVRSAAIYYFRMMGLRNGVLENLDLLTRFTSASEYQLRLQAISVIAELIGHEKTSTRIAKLPSRDDLGDLCLQERNTELKESCLFFLSTSVAVKR